MNRQPPAGDNVSYPAGRVGVVRLAHGLAGRDCTIVAESEHDEEDALPQLTDASFEEMIRQVDDASARLRRS